MKTTIRLAARAAALAWILPAFAFAATEPTAPSPPPLPPPATGREVVADAKTLVFDVAERSMSLKDFNPEESRIIAEINRSPSTWQCYLLYTQEDLPERLFHPGFTIVLDRPKKGTGVVPDPEDPQEHGASKPK